MADQWLLKKLVQEPKNLFLRHTKRTSVIERWQKFFYKTHPTSSEMEDEKGKTFNMKEIQGYFKNSGVFTKLFLLLAIVLFFILVATPIVGFIGIFGSVSPDKMKLSQLIVSVAMFVIPPFVLAFLCSENGLKFLHLDTKTRLTDIVFVVIFMIVIIPFINLLGDLNHQLVLPKAFSGIENMMKLYEAEATRLTEKLLNIHSINALVYTIFVIAIIPAIGEELFFRGALQGILQQWKGWIPAIWMAAFIFSAIHFQFYGFIPRMLMGAFFGYLLLWSGNIGLAILAHFTNNVIAVIFYYLKNNGVQTFDIDTIGTGNTLWIGIVSGILSVFGVLLLKKILQKRIPLN